MKFMQIYRNCIKINGNIKKIHWNQLKACKNNKQLKYNKNAYKSMEMYRKLFKIHENVLKIY